MAVPQTVGGASAVGLGIWGWRAATAAGILGSVGATAYYNGKAEGVSKVADSRALELAQAKAELVEEQARLAEIERQTAEINRMRDELGGDFGASDLLAAVVILAVIAGVGWYALDQRAKAKARHTNAYGYA